VAVLLLAPPAALAEGPALMGTSGDDAISGTPGPDTIFGLAGNDAIAGAAGDDDLDGGAGADDLRGGPGNDAVVYGDRTAAVAVTLDDVANDGEAGEGDNVHSDVEQIFGGAAGDRLTGNGQANIIDGAGGDDSITDGGGIDKVYGGEGDDVITTFDGSPDVVDCGPGNDTLTADRADRVTGCEKRIPARRVRVGADYRFNFRNGRGVVAKLTFAPIPGDATVEVRCSGGCAVSVVRLPKGRPKAVLAPLFRARPLPKGARLEVRITQPGSVGAVFRFDMARNSAKPSKLCLPPGGKTPMKVC
jgi:Ca2+-binding RTX toxin-like protein